MGMGSHRWSHYAAALLAALIVAVGVNAAAGQRFGVYKQPKAQGPLFVPGEVLVKFKAGVGKAAIAGVHGRHGTKTIYTSPFAGFNRVRIPKGKAVADAVKALRQEAAVEYAEANSICHAHGWPAVNDPIYVAQWHLDTNPENDNPAWHGPNGGGINLEPAWGSSQGAGVIVAVIDSGVAYENSGSYVQAPDLADTSFVPGYDFVNNDAHPNDDNAHGTHVTGTIAQSTNNGVGVAGVAFNCTIMPVKVLDANGSGTAEHLAEGLYYAANNGAKVINMSLGWPVRGRRAFDPGATVHNAVIYAYNAGVTIVCSSGNDGKSVVAYPAAYPECIAVGGTRYDETRASYSNYGAALDIVAPGGDLGVDQNDDGYGDGVLQNTFNPNTSDTSDFDYWYFHGTSMAAPHVTGVAALVIASGVTDPDAVRQKLIDSAEKKGFTGWHAEYGYGIVDAAAALNELEPNDPPVVTITSPTQGTASDSGAPVTFVGTATDTEDGNISAGLAWTSDRDGPIGSGGSFTTSALTDGVHVITAAVTDSGGKTASASITIGVGVFALSDADWGDAYRWRDIAENTYSASPDVRSYAYSAGDGATVFLDITSPAETFAGHLAAIGLKPNFAYQVKLNGKPTQPVGCPLVWADGDDAANEILGYNGRWYMKKVDKTTEAVVEEGNSTDAEYQAWKAQNFQDSGYWYFFEGYLLFDYFVTDENGDAEMPFGLDSSYHVLWKEGQPGHTYDPARDSAISYHALTSASFLMPWYDQDPSQYATGTFGIYAEWEPGRSTPGNVLLPEGLYNVRMFLTEESFHSPWPPTDGGYWQTVMAQDNVQFTVDHPAPTADFVGVPTTGSTPLSVQFTDQSTGTIETWSWDFGDGGTSTAQNPTYTYETAATYTVSLTVTGPGGSDTMTKTDYIVVTEPVHDVAVTSITTPSAVVKGDTVDVVVTVANEGNQPESFSVALSEAPNGTTFLDQNVDNLAAGASTDVVFQWDTTNATEGDHALTAQAGPVTDESDLTDNQRSTTVTVNPQASMVIRVASIDMSLRKKGRNWSATALVTVLDQDEAAADGATIAADWFLIHEGVETKIGSSTGTTNGTGQVTLQSPPKKAQSGDVFKIVIVTVTKAGYTYDDPDPAPSETSPAVP